MDINDKDEKEDIGEEEVGNSREYINIEDIINNNQIIKLYQFQVNNNNYNIKLVAETHKIPEMIIKENFGINNSFSLYSYIYEKNEIINNTCLPLIKLIKINNDKTNWIYSLCIKYTPTVNNEFVDDKFVNDDFTIIFVNAVNNTIIDFYPIEKNITSINIIETLLTLVVEMGVIIY
jgi:hypothetical protein